MSDPGWPRAATDGPPSQAEPTQLPADSAGFESDLAELAAKFSAHGGGMFPADLSAELALEIVLNEIVEQACLATGATGAAVVLKRDGEMVCRASSGPTAPELGARLDVAAGLSGECIRTGQTQRCDDTQFDPRADAAASRRLGVRSALILPLVGQGEVIGLFEIFSPRARAFGERDERTLEALAVRVMRNLERAAEPLEAPAAAPVESPVEAVRAADPFLQDPGEGPVIAPVAAAIAAAIVAPVDAPIDLPIGVPIAAPISAPIFAEVPDQQESVEGESVVPRRRFDVVGWALGAAVLACTLLLAVLIVQRFSGTKITAGRLAVRSGTTATPGAAGAGTTGGTAAGPSGTGSSAAGAATSRATVSSVQTASKPGEILRAGSAGPASAQPAATNHPRSPAPAGSLLVFENGKEVFRMPPSQGESEQPGTAQSAVERASLAPERVVDLSPAAAESSLIHRVEPDYPEPAREQQVQGAVVLDVHIGQDGAVQDIKLVSGDPLLADAAVAAVKQWRFQPRSIDGAPAEMQTRVTLNFRLSN
ncbi:MAG TPA: TonB family protein [Candidatus Sulfotelmatobacter sp.]|nr:TonB family protein [Candidatus Sulfotelmatobacter sp.]